MEMDRQQHSSPEGQKSPALRHFSSADPLKTYENRPNTNNHIRALNQLGSGKRLRYDISLLQVSLQSKLECFADNCKYHNEPVQPVYSKTVMSFLCFLDYSEIPNTVASMSRMPNRTDYLIVSPTQSQGVVLQGRPFQHTHNVPAAMRKPVQRRDHCTTQQPIQTVEVESIILTCPESPANDNVSIKRRAQQHSRRPSLEGCLCGKCSKSSENHSTCEHCGNPFMPEVPHLHHPPAAQPTSPMPRPPIRPHPQHSHQHPSPGPNSRQLTKNNSYVSSSTMRAPALRVDTVMNPPIPVRITTRAGLPLPHNGRPAGAGLVGSCCAGKVAVVLSSDEDEVDNTSTGSVNRLDSVSPRPADSAHSSPAPSGGRVEAAVKSSAGGEQEEITSDFFADVDSRISLPRRNRMKDKFGNQMPDDSTPRKKQRISPDKLDSIILDCRSVRVGTLRRMVTKPVNVRLRASELISCEWCSVKKLPVLFFQTSPEECLRLRTQLKMTRDKRGLCWYDCAGNDSDEKYIVLIFENGLSMHQQMILEEILQEIGRANNLNEFPTKLSLMVYPPPPAKGGISVTNEDLHCLNDGEFLNDVIIDFYLKYLVLEKLKKEDSQRSHVFSSFFYKRLNQKERRNVPDTTNLPMQKRKHNRVKTWTRHVDLAHWYLAVICFPGMQGPQFEPNPLYQAPGLAQTQSAPQGRPPDHCRPLSPEPDYCEPPGREEPLAPSEKLSLSATEASSEGHSHSEQPKGAFTCPNDGLHRISLCYGSGGGNGDDTDTFSDDQSSCQDECSEDGALTEDLVPPESSEWTSKPTICKQPCILIMDSLRGPARSSVIKTLREYLEVEWEVRKGSRRSFGRDQMKGSSPHVPQQDNFSDCGVYILQYVESFFENPLTSFHLPVNLEEWFPQQRMKTKREEIKELILKIQAQQEMKAGQGSAKCSPAEQEVGEEDTGEGVEIQNLPVSP
ncbi:unnamed protein product, partial [Coregonus sp. 'balchen']